MFAYGDFKHLNAVINGGEFLIFFMGGKMGRDKPYLLKVAEGDVGDVDVSDVNGVKTTAKDSDTHNGASRGDPNCCRYFPCGIGEEQMERFAASRRTPP